MADSIESNLLHEILPEELDWERLVVRYPIPALLLAAVGGFLLGRSHGPGLLTALSSYAAAEMSKNVGQILGQDIG
ncbi:MAG TPA: hypothetical protein VMW27_23950 [Thermoanaerobaculia bacterium]|nr:hypothetical protein [Thermoanaerobaculia bacterium]